MKKLKKIFKLINLFRKRITHSFVRQRETSLLIILGFIFFLIKDPDYKLFLGSGILLFMGIKYLVLGIKQKDYNIMSALFFFFLGLLCLLTEWVLPHHIFLFMFLFLSLILAILIVFCVTGKFIGVVGKFLSLAFLIISFVNMVPAINSFIESMRNPSFWYLEGYSFSLLFLGLLILFCFLIFKTLIELYYLVVKKDKSSNMYLAFALSLCLFILIGGYYYLQNLKNIEDKLNCFLIIISLAFFTSFTAVNSLKQILRRNREHR